MARTNKSYSIRAYFSFIGTFKRQFFLVFGCFLLANTFLAVIPVFIGKFVAALAQNSVEPATVYTLATILILCSLAHEIFWKIADFLYLKLLNSRSYEFQNLLFDNVIKQNYPYFVGKFTGKISSYITNLGREFREFIDNVCYSYGDMMIKLPGLVIIMFTVNALTGFIFLSSIIVMTIVGRVLIRQTAAAERKSTDVGSSMDGYIIDVIANFVSVKAFKKEAHEVEQVERKRQHVVVAANRSFFWSIVFWGAMGIIVRSIVWPGTILLNVYLFLHHEISLAQITTFMSAILIFSDYIWDIIWHLSQFNLKLARVEESYQYLFGKTNIVKDFYRAPPGDETKQPMLVFDNSLELYELKFAYPDKKDRLVLNGINLSVSKNEKVGVVGKSGSGKTTLIKLLLGYYQVSRESLLIDDTPTDNKRLVDLISYVPQDTSLFHRTIFENIAYSADKLADQEAVELAARRAHAHEFIVQSPGGYGGVVGERGIKLSMGQRQRIAIARAFLDDKPILILDEATSALDSESERLVQEALEDLWHGKTVIAIAHRLSTLRHMDRIVVMDGGKIVEQGTHQELLDEEGLYYRLWQHQSNGIIVDE